jgi:flagellar motility protein MotE (MotC chaperone)
MIKKLYHGVAMIALVNLFAVAGLVGYLFATGRLNEERVNQIGKVLRGQFPKEPEVASTQPVATQPAPQESRAEIADLQAKRELYRLVGERLQNEVTQRQALNDSVQLEVLRRLEEIEKKNQRFEQEKKEFKKQSEQQGFTQVLDMYSSMDPKLAKDLLRTKEKDADVVQLLMKMDPNRRTKIVNACKSAEDRVWIRRILDQIQVKNDNT